MEKVAKFSPTMIQKTEQPKVCPKSTLKLIGTLCLIDVVLCIESFANSSNLSHNQTTDEAILIRVNEIGGSSAGEQKCENAERELDRCSAKLIGFGNGDNAYPDSMQELDTVFCPRFKDTVACIKSNTRCYKPFQRQIINWILTSTRRMNYKRCKNDAEKQRFLKLTQSCLAVMKNPMDRCMSNYISSLDAVAEVNESIEHLTEDDNQIQLSCCANMRFKQCVANNAKDRCRSSDSLRKLKRTNSLSSQRIAQKYVQKAMLDTMEDLKTTLDGMALTGPEFVCSGVDEKFCRTKFDGRYNGRGSKHQSILPAMMKIYSNKW